MEVLVVGATGATGRLLVEQLLKKGVAVRAVVRSAGKLDEAVRSDPHLKLTEASLLDLGDTELANLVKGCDAVASCLGHNLTFKGLFGKPRLLVTEAVRRLCAAINANSPAKHVRFVLMNTTAVRNKDLNEARNLGEHVVNGLLFAFLPPHRDNTLSARYLRKTIGIGHNYIEWMMVRPDSLVDEEQVTEYQMHPLPIRSPIFNAGKTSRINVANFMARLITDDDVWETWRGKSPVIYNQ